MAIKGGKRLVAAGAAAMILLGMSAIPASAVGPGVAFGCPNPQAVTTYLYTKGVSIIHLHKQPNGITLQGARYNPRGDSSLFSSTFNSGIFAVSSTGYKGGQYVSVEAFDAYCS